MALIGSNVPVVIVKDWKAADFEITGRHVRQRGSGFSQEWIEEATITVTDLQSGVVLDAYALTSETVEQLARACAKRFQDRVAMPTNQTAAIRESAPVPSVPASSAPRIYVQGDFNRLADFIQTLRAELRTLGVTAEIVQRGEDYEARKDLPGSWLGRWCLRRLIRVSRTASGRMFFAQERFSEFSMRGRLDSIDISVLVLIVVLILTARYGGWGRGWKPPRGPFSG